MALNESIYKKPMAYYKPKENLLPNPEQICKANSSSKTKYSLGVISFLLLVTVNFYI